MSLEKGAETVVNECLKIRENEKVVVVTDGVKKDIIEALLDEVKSSGAEVELIDYEEPENHGSEPPENVAEAMKSSDVFIAPTKKSISHTEARVKACENGARGATMPGITHKVWNQALQSDYQKVRNLSEKVYKLLEDTETVHITTSSGTDLKIDIKIDYFHTDTGIIDEPGMFGNLPAGEADGGSLNARGKLVIDHLPFSKGSEEAVVEIKDNKVVAVKAKKDTELEQKFQTVEGAKQVAELGIGTNTEAELIDNLLQDEKVLGTVHVAFGDNTSYFPEDDENRNPCSVHWDTVCIEPTVKFDDQIVIEEGLPRF